MGSSLTGTKIKDTYSSLIKVSDNGALDGTLQTITDGLGNNSSLSLSTAGASVAGTLAVSGNATFDTTTLVVDASNNRVGIGVASPSFNLDVRGTANVQGTATAQFFLQSNSGGYFSSINVGGTGNGLGYTTGELYIANPSNVITFNTKTSSGESMRIDSSGNVGINTQNLYGKLSVEAPGNHITLRAPAATAGKYWALDVSSANQFYLINNAGTQYLTMTDSGNVGIGTSTFPLVVPYAAGNTSLTLAASSADRYSIIQLAGTRGAGGDQNGQIDFINTSSTPVLTAQITALTGSSVTDGILNFKTASSGTLTERMRITSGGNALFNCQSAPSASVEGFMITGGSSGNASSSGASTSAYNHLLFYNGNGIVGYISTSGSSTTYATSSDYRLKEDWQPMEGALDRVDALKPVNFAWKADGSRVDGFLAHELADVVPEAVIGEKDATEIRSVEVSPAVYEDVIHPAEKAILDEEGNVIQEAKEEWIEKVLVSEAVFEDQELPVYQGIDQSKIVPLLVAAIQELKARIETLENA